MLPTPGQIDREGIRLNLLKMQPTSVLYVSDDVDEALAKLRRAIKSPEFVGQAESAGACLDFKVSRAERRFWSPHLSVHLSEHDEGAELYCRFSPRPEIWTGVMATYFGAVFAMFVAAIYGYVQWMLGGAPWALLVIPMAGLAIAGLHTASLIGQGLSSDQMEDLQSRLDRLMELAFNATDRTPNSP